tara:strand:- start:68 stop:1447 length:1380 start_codon:yes stop_codon:yes gene_type:complete
MSFTLKEQIHPKSNLNHPHYPELVNNFVLYHKMMDSAKAEYWDNRPPVYGNYDSILDIYQEIIDRPEDFISDGSITVKCPVTKMWTCDAKLHWSEHANADLVSKHNLSSIMGYDRLNKYDEIMNKAPKFMKKKDGFSSTSDTLHAMVRWIYDDNGKVIDFVLVKDRGNLRCHMALASNAGEDTSVLVAIDFHELNLTPAQMLELESETFVEDAKDRRGHDPVTSFRSGYLAKRRQFVAQKHYLENVLKVDFGGVINAERRGLGKKELEFDLSSTQRFDFTTLDGHEAGYITKYGTDNLVYATETLKEIMKNRNCGTHIVTSAIHTFAKTFYYLTEKPEKLGITDPDGKRTLVNALSDKDTVKEALLWMYTQTTPNRHNKGDAVYTMSLKKIQKSGSDKDTTWLGFKNYVPALLDDLRQGKANSHRTRSSNAIIQAYIGEISEGHLQTESARLVDSFGAN